MDVRMASRAGSGMVGGGGGGSYSRSSLEKNNRAVAPQVTLDISAHPPTLDTAGSKPSVARPTSGFCGSTKKAGVQLLTSIRNAYNSMRSGPSLTWVNPGIVNQECHTAPLPHPINAEVQYPMLETTYVEQPLWYAATPGSQFGYLDPLQGLPYPYAPSVSSSFTHSFPTMYTKQMPCKPLNPEAKEWLPNNYKDEKRNKSPIPTSSLPSDPDFHLSGLKADEINGFDEITQKEIDDVRRNVDKKPKKPQDHNEETSNKSASNGNISSSAALHESCEIAPKDTQRIEYSISPENTKCHIFNRIEGDPALLKSEESKEQIPEMECTSNQHENTLSLSYASIIRKSPEPPLQTKKKLAFEGRSTSLDSAKQPIPKIFMKDKIYPKEKAPLAMESKTRDPLPFKTASKTQKRSSRKFLKDLKEMSPVKSDVSFSGSECSIDSSSEIMARLGMAGSPVIIGLHANDLLREKCGHSPQNVKSQRSMSESSASSSHVRTLSESTMGSVESIDIEFGDDFEILDKIETSCITSEKNKPRNTICGKSANSIFAHILGFDDSDSEDSDEDDGDWDTVQECVTFDDLDSWQTCGLMIPMITKSSCSKSGDNDQLNITENICGTEFNLDSVNKKWNEEIHKDTSVPSPIRVSFGHVKVFPMVAWSYAYKNARRGPWEQHARDRARFQNRILSLEPVLSPVFTEDHRRMKYEKIYGQ